MLISQYIKYFEKIPRYPIAFIVKDTDISLKCIKKI